MSAFSRWANKLGHDKLRLDGPVSDADRGKLVEVVAELTARFPDVSCAVSYKQRQTDRRAVCQVAMDLGIDLLAVKCLGLHRRGNPLIGRGLLDVWMVVLEERFGSNVGTNAKLEVIRRGVMTKLAADRPRPTVPTVSNQETP